MTGLAALTGGGAFLSIYNFRVVRQQLQLRGLQEPLKAVQLTDLHYGPYLHEASVDAWVAAALAEQPDVLLLTGDYADARSRRNPAGLLRALSPLSAPLGVWATWGNHDLFRRSQQAELAQGFRRLGFNILQNRAAFVRDDLQLAGIDDWKLGQPDLPGTLSQLEAGPARVLLTHNPDALPEVPEGAVDLAIAGHTHGGQIVIPGVGAPITSSDYGQRFLSGWVEAPVKAYVSRGLGVTSLPFRVLCPPELTVFELLPG